MPTRFYMLFLCLPLLQLAACLQNAESSRVPVRYTVLVRDSYTGETIEGAEVALTGEDETERKLKTNDAGRVVFPSLESYVNQVIVTKKDYIPTDTVDVVTVSDTSLSLMLRTLNLTLTPKDSASADSTTDSE
ncbi:carboxypeptidase regulatory-like domain-containing protein [Fibrobacter sp. UWR2]|uniref:carboxypeptidase regulatory-like domain-containing protein n=1 Tax=Fibrobacter sp. UWR2 TaxID=1964352 RepID=UPI001183C600|nr:carboxypeptidase regulatory-like domain-containing protein [Fibrobacter sp. UWR2]